MSEAAQRFRVGFRRELLILLPVALLLLVVLSTFALLSYRAALRVWAAERERAAVDIAAGLAEAVSERGPLAGKELRRGTPGVLWVGILDADGRVLGQSGDRSGVSRSRPLSDGDAGSPVSFPDAEGLGVIGAQAPASWRGRPHFVEVQLDASRLAQQRRSLRVLAWVILGLNGALAVLLAFYMRRLLAPYDTLLAKARQTFPQEPHGADDEMGFLVASFERALETLKEDALKEEAVQKSAEADEIEALQRMLGPSLESGFLLIGRSSEVLALNSIGANLLGLEAPTSSRPLEEALAGQPRLRDLIAAAVAEERPIQRQQIDIDAGGRPRTVGLSLHPLRGKGGPPRGFLVLFADLTESRLKARDERIATSLAQVGEMAAGVAHEMRNSLATIRGYLTLAERRPEEASAAAYMADVRHEADHLQRVLEDFLTFARPGSTRMELLDLAAIAQRATVDPALSEVEIRLEAEPGLAPIQGDPQLLERAVRNLLRNAAEAQAQTGTTEPLALSVSRAGDGIALTVADRGAGIPEDLRDRIFEPFVTGRSDGIGLGLSLAHRIVALHGGSLRLEDRGGGGTVALVSFPFPATGRP